MIKPCTAFFVLGLTAVTSAQVQVSLGIRETEAGGGTFTAIGADGGSSGGIEWVNLDGQTLTLDGTWQQFTFNITTDPLTGFAGTTANSLLEGTFGTIEHVRVLNSGGQTDPIQLWIDDVENTTTPGGGGPVTASVSNFEGYSSGTEVMFQEPPFSGSTSASLVAGGTSGVDNLVASRSSSCRFDFQFVDGIATRWVRLTTFNSLNVPNPLIRFDDNSVVTFWMRGGECQEDLGSQGPGNAISELCGTGLNTGESSTYYIAGTPANALGAVFVSLAGQPDFAIFGGNLVSGTGVAGSITVAADSSGKLAFPISGLGVVADLVLQSVFLDSSQTQGLAFTNAIQARFGQ